MVLITETGETVKILNHQIGIKKLPIDRAINRKKRGKMRETERGKKKTSKR